MSVENREREYKRIISLGKVPPPNLVEEFEPKEAPVLVPKKKAKKVKK